MAATPAMVLAGSAAAGTAPGAPLLRFEQQRISWHACKTGPDDETGAELAAAGARCGEVTEPLDYRDPGGRTISIAVARRAATDAAHKLGTLIVNTGGPGPSRDGVTTIAKGVPELAPRGAPDLAARYDLIGIDPRFFGLSSPLDCGWPTNLAVRFRQFAAPDRRSFDTSVADDKDLAARCKPFADRLPFGSTRNIARDTDIVRAALGHPKISYLGWSYGTYLGAVYLQMFPGAGGPDRAGQRPRSERLRARAEPPPRPGRRRGAQGLGGVGGTAQRPVRPRRHHGRRPGRHQPNLCHRPLAPAPGRLPPGRRERDRRAAAHRRGHRHRLRRLQRQGQGPA